MGLQFSLTSIPSVQIATSFFWSLTKYVPFFVKAMLISASVHRCHPPNPRATFMNVDFFSIFLCSWHVEPARASQGIWVNQDIEQPFDHRFGILAVALDAVWISQGQNWQAMGGIPLANSHFQRFGTFR